MLANFSFFGLAVLCLRAHARPLTIRSVSNGPAISSNFPDPAFMSVNGRYYAFSTNNGVQHVPIASSGDFNTWVVEPGMDALPSTGVWSNGQNVWAPSAVQTGPDSFVLYYAATLADGSTHCIGAATSTSPQGPFAPSSSPLVCPSSSMGGAIDPAAFLDTDGTRYILYKIDGNSVDNACTVNSVPTPIMIQALTPDGLSTVGSPQTLLVQDPTIDGPLIEGPSLTVVNGVYFLLYSSGCFTSPSYKVNWAVSRNGIFNGGIQYGRSTAGPLLQTGSNLLGLFAPGGLSVGVVAGGSQEEGSSLATQKVVFMADQDGTANTRQMWTGSIKIDSAQGTISI